MKEMFDNAIFGMKKTFTQELVKIHDILTNVPILGEDGDFFIVVSLKALFTMRRGKLFSFPSIVLFILDIVNHHSLLTCLNISCQLGGSYFFSSSSCLIEADATNEFGRHFSEVLSNYTTCLESGVAAFSSNMSISCLWCKNNIAC